MLLPAVVRFLVLLFDCVCFGALLRNVAACCVLCVLVRVFCSVLWCVVGCFCVHIMCCCLLSWVFVFSLRSVLYCGVRLSVAEYWNVLLCALVFRCAPLSFLLTCFVSIYWLLAFCVFRTVSGCSGVLVYVLVLLWIVML